MRGDLKDKNDQLRRKENTMQEEKWGTYKVTIRKIGRKWMQIEIHYPSGYTQKANIDKNSLIEHEEGDTTFVSGCLRVESNGYGKKATLVAADQETVKQGMAQRWWGYFKENAKKGQYYERAVEEMHNLGCYEHDEEIREIRREIFIDRWIDKFRSLYRIDVFGEKAVEELHKLNCYDYDEEIARCKKEIDEKKQEKVESKRQEAERRKNAEKEAGITVLALPAYNGFRGRPEKGSYLMRKGIPYKVLSAYYHDCEGMSFGAMHEEWYEVKAQDISNTDVGQKMIADEKRRKLQSKMENDCMQAERNLESAIRNSGNRYVGKEIGMNEIPGEVLIDTFNIYGGGIIIQYTEDTVWLIVNNGSDGDAWDINNIRTGGAGAYGFYVSINTVKDTLQAYKNAKKVYEDEFPTKK